MILFFKIFVSLALSCEVDFLKDLREFDTVAQHLSFSETEARMQIFSDGSEKVCFAAAGIYNVTRNGENHEYEFSNLNEEEAKDFYEQDFKLVYKMKIDGKSKGYIFLTSNGWLTAEPVDENEYATLKEKLTVPMLFDLNRFRAGGKTKTFKFSSVQFSRDMLGGQTPDGGKLTYNSSETIDRFVKAHPKFDYAAYLDNKTVRIPPKMYEILDDPEFKNAHAKKNIQRPWILFIKKLLK